MAIAQIKKLMLWVLRHTSDGFYVRFMHYLYLPMVQRRWPGILHLRNPKSFSEKIIYLGINIDRLIPDAHIYADKLAVRKYVADTIGEQHLVPLLGAWDRADEITWSELPNRFALKTNHGSGFNILVPDRTALDIDRVVDQLNGWLATDYSQFGRENHYRRIPPRVFAEELLGSGDEPPIEYKYQCFNGICKIISVTVGGHTNRQKLRLDPNWNALPFRNSHPPPDREILKPASFDQMVSIAETLAAPFFYVRVDLYEVEEVVYFGELTFTPTGGTDPFSPPEWNRKLGDLLHLPR